MEQGDVYDGVAERPRPKCPLALDIRGDRPSNSDVRITRNLRNPKSALRCKREQGSERQPGFHFDSSAAGIERQDPIEAPHVDRYAVFIEARRGIGIAATPRDPGPVVTPGSFQVPIAIGSAHGNARAYAPIEGNQSSGCQSVVG